ncbi:carboxypeptidase S3, penicillopeptidase S3, CPD-S3 [Xylariales sp. PMI_506]|nr:carboxypeptidase S3, penicillopeptidase S3, CPD-S3 [Xylariales sp. PMI_506]
MKAICYTNKITLAFLVESLPDVPFDVGELYSGLIPIDPANTSNALFFIFQPTIGAPRDETRFFQETGRFVWLPGTYRSIENPYSWVNETNMLWIDQPVGTGYSIGTPVVSSEEEMAQDFIKYLWYQAFLHLLLQCHGSSALRPCIGNWDYTQQEVPVVPFARANNNMMGHNATFLAELELLHQSCGFADYIDTYLQFPPPGNQPSVFFNSSSPENSSCALWEMLDNSAFAINPALNVYAVSDQYPLLWDILGHRTQFDYIPTGAAVYLNRTDVKKAMHAPDINWYLDQHFPVFVASGGSGGPEMAGDVSADPIQSVLPRVIEATNRVLVSNGNLDMIIITNGTLLSIQNMTWNGQLSFQTKPNETISVELPHLGVVGVKHYERGLMWAETFQGTHVQPETQPRAALKHLQWLLGLIDDL